MQIHQSPQLDQVIPWKRIVVLGLHPEVLVVLWEDQRIIVLGTDKSLMVVPGRINQVPDNFCNRPSRIAGTVMDRDLIH